MPLPGPQTNEQSKVSTDSSIDLEHVVETVSTVKSEADVDDSPISDLSQEADQRLFDSLFVI